MTSHELYVVAIRLLAAYFLALGLIVALSFVTGPFATLIVGVILYFYARSHWQSMTGTGS